MTPDTRVGAVDLDIEIKELQVQLRQADITDKERIASQLAELREQKRNKNKGTLQFRFPLHRLNKSVPITTGGAKDD